MLFLGRHAGYPVALEGALKLKELAYIHAEGFAAGELKHGPIALVEDGHAGLLRRASPGPRPAARQDGQRHPGGPGPRRADDLPGRGGRRADRAVRRRADPAARRCPVLLQPLVAVVPLQLFACELATAMGHDVDQPRNLAKSVTVE